MKVTDPIIKAGAVAGSLAAIAGLVFLFAPGLRPGSNACPQEKDGQIARVVATGGSFADYLDQAGIGHAGRSERELATQGFIVDYDVTTTGYRGKQLPLRWSLVDAKTNRHVSDPSLTNQQALTITPDACTYHVGHPIWVRPPAGARRYYVQLYLYDDRNVQLDSARSSSFT